MNKKFKKGQKVNLKVNIGGIITYEERIVSRVNKQGVWLDNGVGNDESGPYDKETGRREMFMGSQTIYPLAQKQHQ